MCGYFVETVKKPQYKSVEEYRDYVQSNSTNTGQKRMLKDPDIECTCCGQQAPHVAAALLKVEDTTPFGVDLSGDPGHQVWLCADCFTEGVRPKSIHYGNVRWNKMGRKIKQRAEKRGKPPW